jgi:hypothetical protein
MHPAMVVIHKIHVWESCLGRARVRRNADDRTRTGAGLSVPRHVALIFLVSAARIRKTSTSIPLDRGLGGVA